jgi:hypothetical protein
MLSESASKSPSSSFSPSVRYFETGSPSQIHLFLYTGLWFYYSYCFACTLILSVRFPSFYSWNNCWLHILHCSDFSYFLLLLQDGSMNHLHQILFWFKAPTSFQVFFHFSNLFFYCSPPCPLRSSSHTSSLKAVSLFTVIVLATSFSCFPALLIIYKSY